MHVLDGINIKGVDKDGKEKIFSLSELGEKIVLYFYPKDNTPYCTQEAKDFRDKLNKLSQKAALIGVSPDSVESHKQFLKKNSLNFPLISDPENQLAKRLGVNREKIEQGKKYMSVDRSTFIIKNGLISKAWKNVNVPGHVDEVIQSL
jgi:thioredoxin-dependent peroxiredoxin